MEKTLIPRVVERLAFVFEDQISKPDRLENLFDCELTGIMHSNGLNVRYLGFLAGYIRRQKRNFLRNSTTCVLLLLLIAAEAVARVIKNHLNALLREIQWRNRLLLERQHYLLVVDELNVIFQRVPDERNEELWNSVKERLEQHLGFISPEDVRTSLVLVRTLWQNVEDPDPLVIQGQEISVEGVRSIVQTAIGSQCTGSEVVLKRLLKVFPMNVDMGALRRAGVDREETPPANPAHEKGAFTEDDVRGLPMKLMVPNFALNVQGNFYYQRALMAESAPLDTSPRGNLELAADLYRRSLLAVHNDAEALMNLINTRMAQVFAFSQRQENSSRDLKELHFLFNRLKTCEPDNANARFLYGQFLLLTGQVGSAGVQLLKAIQLAPWCSKYIFYFANYLKNQHRDVELARCFEVRANVIQEIMTYTDTCEPLKLEKVEKCVRKAVRRVEKGQVLEDYDTTELCAAISGISPSEIPSGPWLAQSSGTDSEGLTIPHSPTTPPDEKRGGSLDSSSRAERKSSLGGMRKLAKSVLDRK